MTTTRPAQRVTQARVVRSEWTKLRTAPSTSWSLLAALVLIVGFGALYSVLRVTRPPSDPAAVAAFDPTAVSLTGVQLAQVSLAAVPRRLPVLWGKAIVLALTTMVLCLPAVLAAFLVGQSILSAERLDTALGAPGVARAVVGSALLLGAVGLLGLGLGALLRGTAGAVAGLFGLLFGPQLLSGLLPAAWSDRIYPYLPVPAGAAVANARPDPAALAPWTGFGLFCLYTAVVLALAAWQLRRRDA
jgi:ABC-2 type transport system permease protein